MLSKIFKFDDLKTTFKKELIGGFTTFLAMVYILSVNPSILSNAKSINDFSQTMPAGGVFLITAIVCFLSTIIMGLISNIPIALGPSMGLNSMFTFTIANNGNLGYEGALIAVMISGVFLVIISATPIRKMIIDTIPKSIKLVITASIGAFISYVGLENIGFFSISDSGFPIAGLSDLSKNFPEILMGLFVLIIIIILFYKKIPGAIAIAMSIGLIISLAFGLTFAKDLTNESGDNIFSIWNGWHYGNLMSVKNIFGNTYKSFSNVDIWKNPTMYAAILIFVIVCIFDTTGTILGVSERIKKYNEEYELKNNALLSDTISVLSCSLLCSAPVTSYIESATGVEQGARSGFSNILIGLLFLLSIPLFPLFELIPSCVSGPATIFIGMLMFSSLKKIEWDKTEIVVCAFFTMLITIVTYSFVNGFAIGLILYTIMMLINKKSKELSWLIYVMDFIFLFYFVIMVVLEFITN